MNSQQVSAQAQVISVSSISDSANASLYHDAEKGITYNLKQTEALNLGKQGKSFVLIGAAGTGKTSVMVAKALDIIDRGIAHTPMCIDKGDFNVEE